MKSTLRSGTLVALCLLGSSPLLAAGIVTLDFDADSPDRVTNVTVGDNGRIFATLSTGSDPDTCGVFGLDATGTLISTFASSGRLSVPHCLQDLQARSGGGFAAIEPSPPNAANNIARIVTRDAAGAITTSVDFFPSLPATQSATRFAHLFDVRSDNKIVIGGASAPTVASVPKLTIALLNPDGTADASFGGGTEFGPGLVRLDTPFGLDIVGSATFVRAMADGKILTAGITGASTYVIRLNADGTPDASFGLSGRVQLPSTTGIVALDSSGRIYVPEKTGHTRRLLADGTLDAGYNGGTTDIAVQIAGIKIDSQDRAVLFGSKGTNNGYVARLDTAGAPDTSFNGTGITQIPMATDLVSDQVFSDSCFGAIQQGDLPILACTVLGSQIGHSDVAIARLTTGGVLDTTFGVNQPDSDPYPDAFSFPDASAPYGTADVVSQPITLTGFTSRTSAYVNGINGFTRGGFSVGCNGTFIGQGTIDPGQTVCVRANASNTPGGTIEAWFTVGGVRGTFKVLASNSPADSVPDAFTFTPKNDVAVSTDVTSNTVTIQGITGFANVTVSGGQFSVGCDASAFTSTATTVTNGTTLCVKHKSSDTLGATTTTTLTVGGVSAPFTSTTLAADTAPDAFAFTDESSVTLGSTRTSNAVTIAGINSAAAISVTGGEYSIGCSGTFTAQAGTITNGQTVCVRHTASSQASSTVTTTLTIGGVSDAFSSTTAASTGSGDSGNGGKKGGGGAMDLWTLAALLLLFSFSLKEKWRARRLD